VWSNQEGQRVGRKSHQAIRMNHFAGRSESAFAVRRPECVARRESTAAEARSVPQRTRSINEREGAECIDRHPRLRAPLIAAILKRARSARVVGSRSHFDRASIRTTVFVASIPLPRLVQADYCARPSIGTEGKGFSVVARLAEVSVGAAVFPWCFPRCLSKRGRIIKL
jgi:hypothetical protein